MIIWKLQSAEIYEYIKCSEKENHVATICAEKDAEFVADGEAPLYFRFDLYSNDDIKRIKSQSEKWQISCVRIEDWDPSFGYTQGKTREETVKKIDIRKMLVQNGNFAGVIDYSTDLAGRYGLFYALISDYVDAPLHFAAYEGYGSSDQDMMYGINYYLQKI